MKAVFDPMTGRWTKAVVLGAALSVAAPVVCAADTPDPDGDSPGVTTHRPVSAEDFDRTDPMPVELQDVDVTEHLGGPIPLDLTFTDETGRVVALSEYFDGQTPVILNLTYFRCPMSCPMILHNLATTLRDVQLTPGAGGYRVLTVSIDPTDTPRAAAEKKRMAVQTLGRDEGAEAWSFLIGQQTHIVPLAEAAGYGYKYLPGPRQYTHRDVVMLLSPEGKVMRYLYGRSTPAMTMQLSLVEASEGKVGTTKDAIRLYCFYYSAKGKYALAAQRLMTAGGAVTVLILALVLGGLWLREHLRGRRAAGGPVAGD